MAHTIGEECNGCGLCARKCPAGCISGEKKQRHAIEAEFCFDCGVCATYCPVSCVKDPLGNPTTRIKPKERPVAVVDGIFCSGCQMCADICPFNCIELVRDDPLETSPATAKVVRPKACVACRLCVTVCGDKKAIAVHAPQVLYTEL